MSNPESKSIFEFEYVFDRPPLHIKPLIEDNQSKNMTAIDYLTTTKAIRDFFKMVEKHRMENKLHLITAETILETGQTVGEFSVCYIQTLHIRRQSKSSASSDNSTLSKKRKMFRNNNHSSKKRKL